MRYYAFNKTDETYFDEGCYIVEVLNQPNEKDLSIARARVAVEMETRLHILHNTTERYVILEGEGVVTVEGEVQVVKQGDAITIMPAQSQKIRNTGKTDLVFLAICTPRFKLQNYQDVDPKPLKTLENKNKKN